MSVTVSEALSLAVLDEVKFEAEAAVVKTFSD